MFMMMMMMILRLAECYNMCERK